MVDRSAGGPNSISFKITVPLKLVLASSVSYPSRFQSQPSDRDHEHLQCMQIFLLLLEGNYGVSRLYMPKGWTIRIWLWKGMITRHLESSTSLRKGLQWFREALLPHGRWYWEGMQKRKQFENVASADLRRSFSSSWTLSTLPRVANINAWRPLAMSSE